MWNVVKDFIYNGVEYKTGGQVDPASLELDDRAALVHGGYIVNPSALNEVVVNRDILSHDAAVQIEADGVVKLSPRKKAGKK